MKDTEEVKSIEYYKSLFRGLKEIPCKEGPKYRIRRKAISELSAEGIIFIPVEPYIYRHIDLCTDDQINKFARERDAALWTQYINKLLPLKKYMKRNQLDKLHFGGLLNDEQ